MKSYIKFTARGKFGFLKPSMLALCSHYPTMPLIALVRCLMGVQISAAELQLVARVLNRRRPCNLLVFGVGRDSGFWRRLNLGGTTMFLEDVREWLDEARRSDPQLNGLAVVYETHRAQWRSLLTRPDLLEMQLPRAVTDVDWDIILIDAPAGNNDSSPGRMQSIYAAAQLAAKRRRTDIFVHDCHREVEQAYSDRFFGRACMQAQVVTMRHYLMDPKKVNNLCVHAQTPASA